MNVEPLEKYIKKDFLVIIGLRFGFVLNAVLDVEN